MWRSRSSEEQITTALQQAAAGTLVAEICREPEVTEATFHRWKKGSGGISVSELRELSSSERRTVSPAASCRGSTVVGVLGGVERRHCWASRVAEAKTCRH
jgi:hypothetical protein